MLLCLLELMSFLRVSVTVAVHDVACPITTVLGVHATVVVVVRRLTVTVVLPELALWAGVAVSPL